MEKNQIEKAFDILFAGFYREMALIVKALEKATYHWNNVAATYSQMCEGKNPPLLKKSSWTLHFINRLTSR